MSLTPARPSVKAMVVGGASLAALVAVAALAWRTWQERRRRRSVEAGGMVLSDATRSLFQQYESYRVGAMCPLGTPVPVMSDEAILARAWSVYHTAMAAYSYRCIEEKRFVEPRIALHPLFRAITGQAEADDGQRVAGFQLPASVASVPVSQRRLLDIGCCFGTDLRSLIVGGFRPAHLLGVDIESTFVDLGLDHLFRDRPFLQERFAVADVLHHRFEKDTPAIARFLRQTGDNDNGASGNGGDTGSRSRVGVHAAYAGSVYHLLSEADTLRLSQSLHRVLLPGGVAFGRTVGLAPSTGAAAPPSALVKPAGGHQLRYLHTADSLRAQLESVGFTQVAIAHSAIDMPAYAADPSKPYDTADQRPLAQAQTALLSFYTIKPEQ